MFQESLVLTLAYVLIVAIAFSPSQKTQIVSPDGPVEYFSEIEAVEPVEKSHLVNLPGEPVTPSPAPVTLPTAIAPEIPLTALGIRELKKLASSRKIPRYGSKTKKELILALA